MSLTAVSMPYAQPSLSFRGTRKPSTAVALYPAAFICRGCDQTRGWFFTLMPCHYGIRLACDLQAVVSNGLVLDKNGEKMSKPKGNAKVDIPPHCDMRNTVPTRCWWLPISCSRQKWDNLKPRQSDGASEEGWRASSSSNPLEHIQLSFACCANVDGFTGDEQQGSPSASVRKSDRWILSLLNTLVKTVTDELDDYEPTRAVRAISTFGYGQSVELVYCVSTANVSGAADSRSRKTSSPLYQTLYTCLLTVSKLMAWVSPLLQRPSLLAILTIAA